MGIEEEVQEHLETMYGKQLRYERDDVNSFVAFMCLYHFREADFLIRGQTARPHRRESYMQQLRDHHPQYYPSLKSVVLDYIARRLGDDTALQKISELEKKARTYLESKGFNTAYRGMTSPESKQVLMGMLPDTTRGPWKLPPVR